MRVALLTFCAANDERKSAIVKTLQAASTGQGNQVDLINGNEDLVNTRLTMYDYVACVVQPLGLFSGKIKPRVAEFLSTSGKVSGKKGCALVLKSGFGSDRTCRALMKAMEGEGLRLDYFEVVKDEEHARYAGKKIG